MSPGIASRSWLAAACSLAILTLSTCPGFAQQTTLLSLPSGHSVTVAVNHLTRVAVGDKNIAGAVPLGTSHVVINAKAPGHTSILVWSGSQPVDYELTVTENTVDDLARVLRTAIDEPNVHVISEFHNIIVSGTVQNDAQFASLNDLLSRFDKAKIADKEGKLINLVRVAHSGDPMRRMQDELATIPGTSNLRVDSDKDGNIIVSGEAKDRVAAEQVLNRVRSMAGPYYGAKGKMIDRIAVADTSQVDVKLYVLEVDRTFLNQLGIRLQNGTPNPNNPNQILLGPPSFPFIEGQRGPGQSLTIGPFFRTTTLVPTLDLLLQTSHARVLSSPDLVTLPGNDATFLVGGEIPIPYSTGLGTYSITYKDFGVKLDVVPTILADGSVQTLIKPEVSNLDFQDAITLNGFVIPALQVSRLNTDVTTKPGESIIMGGLLKRVEQRQINKIPLLGDIPVLGKLFRSTLYQRTDTDVVFVMTPTIITR